MVFRVASRSRPGRSYRVDLLFGGGAGRCACKDFGVRRQPALDAGGMSWTAATTCVHCRAAARHFLRGLLAAMAKQEEHP